MMAAVGEIWLLLQDRIDASGYLTLDDGAVQPLVAGDDITVAKKEQQGAAVLFVCDSPKSEPISEPCRGRPEAIIVCPPVQKCATVAMPGKHVHEEVERKRAGPRTRSGLAVVNLRRPWR
jgi:hypothetical protein